jgi:hypothetical protein
MASRGHPTVDTLHKLPPSTVRRFWTSHMHTYVCVCVLGERAGICFRTVPPREPQPSSMRCTYTTTMRHEDNEVDKGGQGWHHGVTPLQPAACGTCSGIEPCARCETSFDQGLQTAGTCEGATMHPARLRPRLYDMRCAHPLGRTACVACCTRPSVHVDGRGFLGCGRMHYF